MPLLSGIDRCQSQILCLESCIASDDPVRLIDAFVDMLNLESLGFEIKGRSFEGRAAYPTSILLKIYIYGYLNRIRSSRQLEKACIRNIDLWWLINSQRPCYKTIAEFRRVNHSCMRKVFRQWNLLCKDWTLFEGETIAIDGSKFRAQNSKKNNYNAAKVERHLEYIDRKIEEYLQLLNQEDDLDQSNSNHPNNSKLNKAVIAEKIETLKDRRSKYELLENELEQIKESGGRQISTTDEDARALPMHHNIVEVGYNIQSAVDAKHKLIAAYKATNEKDDRALFSMAIAAQDFLESSHLDVLADKGYHTGEQFEICEAFGIDTYVAVKENSSSGKKHPDYRKNKFRYDAERDCYHCPQGKQLRTTGSWYVKKSRIRSRDYQFQRYAAPLSICQACPTREQCGPFSRGHGRYIERTEYDDSIEANKKRVDQNKNYYRLRQQIVEHPFGTIKRQWGYSYTLLKTLPKVDAEFGLIFLAYNMRRCISILGVRELVSRLKRLCRLYFVEVSGILRRYDRLLFYL